MGDGVRYDRRSVVEDYLPEYITITTKYLLSAITSGCMCESAAGRIQVRDGKVHAITYTEEALKPKNASICKRHLWTRAILHLSTRSDHTARRCMAWFEANNLEVLERPGNNRPQLN
ncbi:unnamed protein product [Darwinula stevensoni]|uniref:Uncharacterized protein n=1 Tax=Darwinula stevensoni TaxID=69355 RepID=A0A7R9FN40_9CRUS|nr:unnamed protein product [Darwinula stevensoni]CAG0896343.1 unnamed protein product [Darwinula stevensoni]